MAQPAEVVAKKIRATEKLQLSDKTLTAIVEAITVLSTHAQSPTAKAVYDLTAAMITSVSTNATLSGNGTAGDPLEIAQQSATSGQVLKWNGSTWLPATDNNTGTVTSVSVTPAQGVTASVTNATTTPNISIGLGAITPTSVAASGNVTGANLSGTNTGNQTISYSAPTITLSGGGGSVAIPQGDITGSGTGDQMTFFTGTKTVTGSSRFTVNNSSLAGLIVDGGDGAGGNGSYVLFRKDGTNNFIFGAESSLFGGTGTGGAIFQYGNNPFFFCTNSNKRMTLLGNGNFGIATTNPLQPLHVVGAARITGNGSTATTLTGRDANSDITNVTLGAGLSLSGGTLSSTATGTVTGTGVSGRVAYWSGTGAITSTANFPFDGTSLAVGRSTAGAGRLNVTGNSTSVGLQVDAGALPDFGSTMQMRASNAAQTIYGIDAEGNTGGTSNYLNKFFNTGTGSSILQLGATSDGTGDPVVQYNITGGGNVWVGGIDNSDADKFKIQPTTSIGSTTTGVTVTTAGLVGINQDAPLVSLQVAGTDGIAVPTGTSAQRPVSALQIIRYNSQLQGLEVKNSGNWHLLNSQNLVNSTGSLTPGLALGTTPTVTINGGHESAYTISLTVGTAPVANEIIYTRTFPSTWSSAPRPVFSAANALAASEITKFYVDSSTSGSYVIRANGTLTAGGLYRLNVLVHN